MPNTADSGQERVEYLTIAEASRLLRISRATAYRAVGSGEIPSVRIGRTIRVPRYALGGLRADLTPPEGAETR